jgi:hypothetical protein
VNWVEREVGEEPAAALNLAERFDKGRLVEDDIHGSPHR